MSEINAIRFAEPWQVSCVKIPMPEPKPGEALIKIMAAGICGSGLIDAAAVFLRAGIIDETGAFTDEEDAYPLTPEVSLTQKDIRMLQLAKSAICAGMLTLLEAGGLGAEGPARQYRQQAAALAEQAETVDLSASPVFRENYVECMGFEAP